MSKQLTPEDLITLHMKFADWTYYDAVYDCDGQSPLRLGQRLAVLSHTSGRDAFFGVAGAWTVKAYFALQDAYKKIGKEAPQLYPNTLQPGHALKQELGMRAMLSASQFVAAVSAKDYDMGQAILNAAYDASVEEAAALLYAILMTCINLKVKAGSVR